MWEGVSEGGGLKDDPQHSRSWGGHSGHSLTPLPTSTHVKCIITRQAECPVFPLLACLLCASFLRRNNDS